MIIMLCKVFSVFYMYASASTMVKEQKKQDAVNKKLTDDIYSDIRKYMEANKKNNNIAQLTL